MASIVSGNTIKLDNGKTIAAQQGGWYDGQQFFNGSLSQAGVINSQSNQQGAGQAVSQQVVAQTDPNNVAYLQSKNAQAAPTQTPQAASGMGGTGGGMGGDGAGIGSMATPPINLPELYKSLYGSSGISDIESQISKYTDGYNTAVSKINDNPWLSEASRTGRQAKLSTDFDNKVSALKNDVATKKADIETQLNLQTKQFDINSQAAQQALSQFNSLLQMGALDNASGEDIANITRSTGLTSNAIYSAIKAQQVKNTPTQVIQYDDGTSQGFAVINPQTGEIISKQQVAASVPKKGTGGGGGGTVSERQDQEKAQNTDSLVQSIKSGATLRQLVEYYSQVLSDTAIYDAYNANSPYGKAKETLKDVKDRVFKTN